MTNEELAAKLAEAEGFLELTTVGWNKVAGYPPAKLATTNWGKARTLIDQVQAALAAPVPVPEPPPPPPPVPSLIWDGNFDSGDFRTWENDVIQFAAGRVAVVADPLGSGVKVARFEVRDGDRYSTWSGERAQLRKGGPATSGEGDEAWWGFEFALPADYVDSGAFYQILFEWHHNGLTGSPPVTFQISKGRYVLRIVKTADAATSYLWDELDLGPATPGQRARFVYHAKFSMDRAKALNEVWFNGTKVVGVPNPNMLSGSTGNYICAGLYRAETATNTQVVYLSRVRRGSSFAAVA